MATEKHKALSRLIETAASLTAFWYLGRLLFSAIIIKPSHTGRTKNITPDNIGTLPYESEQLAALALLRAFPGEPIIYEPFDVLLEADENDGSLPIGTTPDFLVHGHLYEVSAGPYNDPNKRDQAAVIAAAEVGPYMQVCEQDFYDLVKSKNPREILDNLDRNRSG